MIAQNCAEKQEVWEWTKPRENAAALVAADKLTDEKIAERLHISRRTLTYWKTAPEFQSRVEEIILAFRQSVLRRGVADLYRRLDTYQQLADKLETVIEERSVSPDLQTVAGGKTGLIVAEVKEVKVTFDMAEGKISRQTVCEYKVDTALTKELRETLKQAAIETGQWTEKKNLSGSLQLTRPNLKNLTEAELEALDALLEKTEEE